MFTKIRICLPILLLAGCASRPIDSPAAIDAADPRAAESPLPEPSHTLLITREQLPSVPIEPPMMHHDMPDGSMSGASHDHSMMHPTMTTQPGENAALSAPRPTPTTLPAHGEHHSHTGTEGENQ